MPDGSHIPIIVHVVKSYIPLLVVIEILHEYKLTLDFGQRSISDYKGKWELPMVRKFGHIFMEWKKRRICYTAAELTRLHLHFFHPTADRLFSVVKKLRPEKSGAGFLRTIKDLTEACRSCKTYSKRPFRCCASMPPDKIVFNH